MAGTSRFDCYPSDFLNGIIGLTADEIAAYTVIVMMLYDRGCNVRYLGQERAIAARAGMRVDRLQRAVTILCGAGKLILHADGGLENPRTTKELSKIRERMARNLESAQKGGFANKEKWAKKINVSKEIESRPDSQAPIRPDSRPDSRNIALLPSSFVLRPEEEDPSDLCPKPDKPVRTRHAYPADFEEFWSAYPTDSNMPKVEALKVWKRLSENDRRDAAAALPAFKRYCASHPDYRPVHASRYLSQRRWEGHLKTAEAVKQRIFVHRDSPQWDAWEKHLRARGRKMPPTDSRGGWDFDSDWPPRVSKSEHERMSA